ncbi:MAG: M67 family metallopeptidase [Chromatiales bacterium]|nr:M67 family metallopeptidase [Chromatiales bacterium]
MSQVTLPITLVNKVLTHAQHSPEEEVCGLISAKGGVPGALYPIANVADVPEKLFTMDPAAQIEAMRRMRESGEELFAIYHSHPHAPAEPSARDLAEAAYPEALYLIISLNIEGVLEMRGFRLHDGVVERVDLEVA